MSRVMVVLGTRPELIKLAPLVHELRREPTPISVFLCSTGQHQELLSPLWDCLRVRPDADLAVMRAGQSLGETSARLLSGLTQLMEKVRPDLVVVQGDTSSTFCGALAAFYRGIPVAHVEAGLRTHDLSAPFPEELNRVLVGRMAQLHFAPTEGAARNLRQEGVPAERVHVTGNTGIDALLMVLSDLREGRVSPARRFERSNRRRAVVTAHRRESFGGGLASVCAALNQLATEQDLEMVLPLHPNPEARERILSHLEMSHRIQVCEPLDYVSFIALVAESDLVITDSGGIQEEAPYLGVPAVVVRTVTERPEGAERGYAWVAGYDCASILAACREALVRNGQTGNRDADHTIYGDGAASRRIRELIHSFLSK